MVVSSGGVVTSGAVVPPGVVVSSGGVVTSGAVVPPGVVVSSGGVVTSGAVVPPGVVVSSGSGVVTSGAGVLSSGAGVLSWGGRSGVLSSGVSAGVSSGVDGSSVFSVIWSILSSFSHHASLPLTLLQDAIANKSTKVKRNKTSLLKCPFIFSPSKNECFFERHQKVAISTIFSITFLYLFVKGFYNICN